MSDRPILPQDLNEIPLRALATRLAASLLVERLAALTRDEDLGEERARDLTGEAVETARGPDEASVEMEMLVAAREPCMVAGLDLLAPFLRAFGGLAVVPRVADGQRVGEGGIVATLRGTRRDVVRFERTLLNVLGRLCGVATNAAVYADAVRGTKANVFDTRKTTPGMRLLEKYAVRCGGACCHRIGLHDAVLIKDNHLAGVAASDVAPLAARVAEVARSADPPASFVEVEVDSLAQFEPLLALPDGTIDAVLLDNFTIHDLRTACESRDRSAPSLLLEASGGVTLETIGEIASTGVDRISVGAITRDARTIDLGLDAVPRVRGT